MNKLRCGSRHVFSYGFGKALARLRLCHPEAKPKDLATEMEAASFRSPDSSLRYAPFRACPEQSEGMTGGAQEPIRVCVTHFWEV